LAGDWECRKRIKELIRRAEEIYRQDIAKNGKPKAAGKGAKNAAAKKRGCPTSAYKKGSEQEFGERPILAWL
jgi:hypothetical protein